MMITFSRHRKGTGRPHEETDVGSGVRPRWLIDRDLKLVKH